MQSSTASQQAFFAEDNLFLLLNVIHDTINDVALFDKTASHNRQKLFETMAKVYRNHSDKPLSVINKIVLRDIYVAVRAQPSTSQRPPHQQAPAPTPAPTQSASNPPTTPFLRDAEVNQRKMPVEFEARPQQAFVRKDHVGTASLDDAMHSLQSNRNADVSHPPQAIDFSVTDQQEDNSDVLARLEDVEKAREVAVEQSDQPSSLADAMKAFDQHNQQLDGSITHATDQQQQQKQKREATFHAKAQYNPSPPEHTQEAEKDNNSVSHLPGLSTVFLQDTPTKLDADVQVTHDVLQTKMDEREFQKALHLSKEEEALQAHLDQSVGGVREELLIAPKNNFVTTVNHLEVCSNDRVRTLPTSEHPDTPYCFTLYFNSNRPSYRVYPIYVNHPIEEPEEYTAGDTECKIKLDTVNVRRCAGLRGYPKCDGMPNNCDGANDFNIDNISHYETVQLTSVAGPNVDSVFYNVVALQTNHVQIYYPHDYAPKYPYIVLEIEQFSNVYKSSNTLIRKSFCKLFYDRSSSPTLANSQYHMYTPMNQEKKVFPTPLASIDRLTFKLHNSFGNPLDTIQDVLHVKGFYLELSGTPSTYTYINILLHNYVPESHVAVDNHITFEDKCLEWYNYDWFNDWYTNVGSTQLANQQDVEEDYYDTLLANPNNDNETLLKLKEDFARKQIQFDFPTTGYPVDKRFSELREFLQRPEGHKVLAVGEGVYDSAIPSFTFSTPSPKPYINCIRIAMPTLINNTTGDVTVVEFGGNNATLDAHILSNDYPLMTGTLLNNSVCTNISMTVVTREEDSVVVSRNV